jgi:phosphate starvation-inducible protein PhoH and related proteins
LARFSGPLNRHLLQIGEALQLELRLGAGQIELEGPARSVRAGLQALEFLYALPEEQWHEDQLHLMLLQMQHPPLAEASPILQTRKSDLQARSPNQARYLQSILKQDITFGVGPAGTGKTYLAVACAVDALERDIVKRIILTRPAVEAGERLGFLPGDLQQKIDPYLRPLYDALYDLMGAERCQKMFEKQMIEVAPLAYMRGRTLNHSFIILDEAQNTTAEQMKMFLTRMGFGSKVVVTGDKTQIDLPKGQESGLLQAIRVLGKVKGIGFCEFASKDVVRHPLIAHIVDAYELHQNKPHR